MSSRRWMFCGAVLAGAWLVVSAPAQTVLSVEEAAKRIGEEVTFEGEIMGLASSPRFPATYASFGGAYPRQKLSMLFAGEHQMLIYHRGARLNIGQTVRVTGTVELERKTPIIRITDSNQIVRVASSDERVPLDAEGDGPVFHGRMRSSLRTLFKAGDYAALDAVAAKWSADKERFLDGSWKIAVFYEAFSGLSTPFPEIERKLAEWQAAFPESVTPRLLHAEAMVHHAWDARGNGVASTVTEEGWKLFQERLAVTRMELAALHARRAECPQWFFVLQSVALGQHWTREEYEALFEEAIRLEPEYLMFYFQKGYYLQPKWHGKEGEWAEFVNSLPTRHPDGLGEELYARLASLMRKEANQQLREKEGRFFPDMGLRWEPMKAGFERIHARYPQSKWILNDYAIFAGKASDWETTQRVLAELGDDCDMDIWVTWDNVALARMWASGKGISDSYFSLFR